MLPKLKKTLLAPLLAMRLRYVPLLLIYFAYGASIFTGIAESFWVKEKLSLGTDELMALGVWLSIPWTIKMVFGQLVDSVGIFGSQRRAYIFIGAGLVAVSMLTLMALAGDYALVQGYSKDKLYIIASVIGVVGFVIQDVVADTMSTEVVDRSQPQEKIEEELAMVQILGRLALAIAGVAVAGLGGWLAQILSYETMFALGLFIPALSIAGVLFIRLEKPVKSPINPKILYGGLVFALFVLGMGYSDVAYGQEIVFVISMAVVLYMLKEIVIDLPAQKLNHIIAAVIVIFIFRATPPVGPGLQWWEIDVLDFDKAFFGTLNQIGAVLAIVGMWLASGYIVKKSISKVLLFLVIVSTLLSLPVIGMYYGLHEWTQAHFGIDARDIALVDTALASPFNHLSMVMMLALIAIYAPAGRRGTWFALMASLMNLALTAGNLISKYLNEIFVVTREVPARGISADYSQLGWLLISATLIGFVLPLLAIYKYGRKL
ncbi:MAG: hypothetical protein ACQERK_02595 [Campylobacterota bacterium]